MKRLAVAFALAMLAGCGQSALQTAKLAGLASKQTAEAAYLTVRVEYLEGRVDEQTMQKARDLYARYALAQQAYHDAIVLWESGAAQEDPAVLRAQVGALAAALEALASNVKWQMANSR